jgi:hypothetical protein
MAAPRIHTEATAVVLLGSFNPRIFEPLWFSRHDLVPEQEAEAAEVQMIDREFCRVSFGWVDLVITEERLQAESTSETVNDSQIRDLLVSIFQLLPHIPVNVGSIHHRWHLAIDTEAEWHGIGHALAPKEIWDGVLEEPGMFDFAMSGRRPDDLVGAIKVRIQPSRAVSPGIFMNVNDEFSFAVADDEVPLAVADVLDKLWSEAGSRAASIRKELLARLVP